MPFEPAFLVVVGLMLFGLVLRFWDLGVKTLHHDESLHAVYSWYLYQGRGYTHDPMMHGPLLFIGNALAYFVAGASDFSSRLVPALLGVALIGMPWLLRHEIGKSGAIAAAVFFAISPTFLYFSRFIRHDIYVDVFTLMMVIGVFRYLATGRKAWFQLTVVGAALLFATKEDFYISGFIPFTFLVGAAFLLRGETRRLYHERIKALGWQQWAIGVAVFLAINVVLYTTFFTNLRGICTAFLTVPVDGCSGAKGALSYWLEQHDVKRGGQPFFYYSMLLPLYEALPLVLGFLALFLVRGKNLFFWFTGYWFLLALVIYSWAGEKMPWMLPQIALPLILVASKLVGEWVDRGVSNRGLSLRGLAVAGLVMLAGLSLVSWLAMGTAQTLVPVEQQRVTLQRLALSVVIAATAGGIVALWSRWGRQYVLPGLAVGLVAIVGAYYVRTSILVNYVHPDTPVEPLIYVQSSPDVVWVANEIERIAQQTGQGKDLRILMDNGWGDGVHEAVAWPFEWYLRDYKNRRYFNRTIDSNINIADYPVILAMEPNIEPIREQLQQYTTQRYHLNWWFPEDYKRYDDLTHLGPFAIHWVRLDEVFKDLMDSQHRATLVKFLLLREPPNPLAGRIFVFGLHKDVPQIGPAALGSGPSTANPPAAQPAPAGPREAVAQTQPDGSIVFGRSPQGAPVLVDPKNVAVGADGRVYVVEGRQNRVTIFNADGTILSSFGSPGQGDGQFQEPWGVAVASNGHIYVADTWNHRVQRFDAEGNFLGKFGRLGDAKGQIGVEEGVFWGPRAIAISPQNEVYVTDTGNKRVQVFNLEGSFLRMFGGEGSQPGKFREPVGIALDPQGNVWVADAWNNRLQHLDPQGRPLSEFTVPQGWESTAITNKPYVAVDGQGRVIATFPDSGRTIVFTPQGEQVAEFQAQEGGTAVGVAVGPDNRAYVADARTGTVHSHPLP